MKEANRAANLCIGNALAANDIAHHNTGYTPCQKTRKPW